MTEVYKTLDTFKAWRESQIGSIGLVPTMGNLHKGHLSLLKESLKENEVSVVTIFVNPKQFGPNEDFDKYPRTLEKDIELVKEVSGDKPVVIFAPQNPNEIYPAGFCTSITVGPELTQKLCGLSRPGHFEGVTTVVYKLFSVTRPQRAYFGQKDFQQFKVIERMVRDLGIPVTLKAMPIVRDFDGIALSSRNQYLNDEERENALTINQTIKRIKEVVESRGDWLKSLEQAKGDLNWEYLEVLDADKLSEVTPDTTQIVIAGACKIGQTRLIDNMLADYNNAR